MRKFIQKKAFFQENMDTNASQPRKNFVFELLKPEMLALQEILKERNWTVVDAPYMVFKASSEKISVAAYQSGKLVCRGRMRRISLSSFLNLKF